MVVMTEGCSSEGQIQHVILTLIKKRFDVDRSTAGAFQRMFLDPPRFRQP